MDTGSIIEAARFAKELHGRISEVGKLAKDATINALLADLQNMIADARMETADLKEQVLVLKEENAELKRRAEIDEEPVSTDRGGYRFQGDDTWYCVACWHKRREKVPTFRFGGTQACPICVHK